MRSHNEVKSDVRQLMIIMGLQWRSQGRSEGGAKGAICPGPQTQKGPQNES